MLRAKTLLAVPPIPTNMAPLAAFPRVAIQRTGCFLSGLSFNKPLMSLICGQHTLDLSRPQVMAILNITPDSFSDGGQYFSSGKVLIDEILRVAENHLAQGASLLDVGGESTRPGAKAVSEQEELDRVIPVVEALVNNLGALVSVDTSRPQVILESAVKGAGLINDVRALQLEGALVAAAKTGLPVCLMHMQGQPQTMQNKPQYSDVFTDVSEFLLQRVEVANQAGISKDKILVDPGFGFGKSLDHNLGLLRLLPDLVAFGYPVLVGLSRKSMLLSITNRAVDQRLAGSLALALLAAQSGAKIIRVHDVAATVDVLKVLAAVNNSSH
jgi:dihydropteroate synthase